MNQHSEPGPIKHLRHAGLRPTPATWDAILALGPAAVPPLLELASDTQLLAAAEPACYAPVHALRLLSHLPLGDGAVQLFHRLSGEFDTDREAQYLWTHELPQMVGAGGTAVLPAIRTVLTDPDASFEQWATALKAQSFAAEADPGCRDDVMADLRARLSQEPDPARLACVVSELSDLHVGAAYTDVMAAYRRGAVDKTIISAAAARQGLLASGPGGQLQCVHHSLAEQYDQHGPYDEAQKAALAELYRQQQLG